MSSDDGWTPTQRRMLEVLSDGLPHTKEELHACCGPSCVKNVRMHLSILRKKLRHKGQDIVCRFDKRVIKYQHVRLLVSAEE